MNQPQFEVADAVALVFRPQTYAPGGISYTVTSDRASPQFVNFDYEPIASSTVGFTKAAAELRFLPQTYQASPTGFPLRDLIRGDLRRWEVSVTRGSLTRHFEINAYTCSNAGVTLHLGSPIDSLTYPSHPLDQLF
jgi:hypothetical protein